MLAIIPARGGSKGLPGKNTKPLLGKPLMAYTIEAALQAKCVTSAVVSTDDEDIARVALQCGAKVPFMRPSELAGDDSPAVDTYLYTIDRWEQLQQSPLQEVIVLLPTCPLRTGTDIDAAVELFTTRQADSVVSYTEEHHPVSWHKWLDNDQRILPMTDTEKLGNRQDYQKTYYPNGAIYVFRKSLLQQRVYYTKNSFAYVMPRDRSVDIDTYDDFLLAEFYLKRHA